MTGLKLLALMPFFGAGMIATIANNAPVIEYGALGLCGMVVLFLCNHLKGMVVQHREERAELIGSLKEKDEHLAQLTKQNMMAYNRLAQLLTDRPCLMKDRRINEEEI